ncbi:chloride channel protein [Limnochorda pilosa]|uniref:Chloride channel protein n=1 Tax=Limnochorda pilosa TaxID=1555112 RepID=A0A0K2SFL5_LIMPI|nr:chloride channel protein [Limnochorda pilosa]BAS25898.1 chloride channel protein [Limnochorda pilosa]
MNAAPHNRAAGPHARSRSLLERLPLSANFIVLVLAVVVGAAGGFASALFYWMIGLVGRAAGLLDAAAPFLQGTGVVWAAILGGLLVGPMTYRWASEARGHGVPEVMEAVAVRGGRIRPRVALVKAVASALTIGTGGSAGREGPIVQIGAGLGSSLGQVLRLSEARVRTLVACGAAAGIAATFNAPIAGAVFSLEVILGEFSVGAFSMVVLASATASVVAWALLGNQPAFLVPPHELVSRGELAFYVVLGLLAALAARAFVDLLYRTEDFFERLPLRGLLKPALGAAGFGLIGLLLPESLGPGYPAIEAALHAELAPLLLLALLGAKMLSTSLTLGSGGSGGVFAPSLFTGAMLGGAFGHLVHGLYPTVTAQPGAYALVGMSAFFAGATQAPITAILILFEMTRDYRIIVPLMLAAVVSTMTANALSRATIYTTKLIRRGVTLKGGRDVAVLEQLTVNQVMSRPAHTVRAEQTVRELVARMQQLRHNGFPVVDRGGRLVGVVTLQDVRDTPLDGRLDRQVREIMTPDPVVAYPDDDLHAILDVLERRDVGRLPVVSRADGGRVLGVITRSDVLRAYNRALVGHRREEPSVPEGIDAVEEHPASTAVAPGQTDEP